MSLVMPSKNAPLHHETPDRPAGGDLPRVDEHLVEPEITRDEVVRGRRVIAAPALEPHGDAHCGLDFAVRGLVRPGYIASTDLLTRVLGGSDFAIDTCVRKEGIDPATGVRYLEELAFEVVSEQSYKEVTERAEDLSARGVRRFFAIFVKRRVVAEWSRTDGAFRDLAPTGVIEDPCLVRPLPARALLEHVATEDVVAVALIAKQNPVLEERRQAAWNDGHGEGFAEGRREALAEGRREGLAEERCRTVERLCVLLEIELTEQRRAALDGMDADALDALADAMSRDRRWP